MPGDIKTKQLFFEGHFLPIGPWRYHSLARIWEFVGPVPEKGNLAGDAIAMSRDGGRERIIDTGNELGAFAIEEVKSARFDETLQHLSIGDSRIEPTTKILQ